MGPIRHCAIVLALLAGTNIPGPTAAQQPAGFIRMPTGDSLAVWGYELYQVRNERPVLVLHYQTRLDLHDSAAVSREILAIWPGFRPAAEQRGMERAAIRALRFQPGLQLASLPRDLWQRSAEVFGMVFTRRQDGHWAVLGDTTVLR